MKHIKKTIVMLLVLATLLSLFAVSASAAGSIAYGAGTVTASVLNSDQVRVHQIPFQAQFPETQE